jgi:ribosome-associated toxin RatA of RatAB toxin-antitoxin module
MPEIVNRIRIEQPPERVYRVARDVESFPSFMPDVESVRIVERSADGRRVVSAWVGLIPKFGLKVRWTEEDLWDDEARTCAFTQVQGDFSAYDGTWRFLTVDSGTLFESVIRYEIEIPLVGPLIRGVIKKTMAENVDRLQQALKRHIEEGPAGP